MQKSPHGSPCNGCGECCKAEVCPLGAGVFGHWAGPCPALEGNGDGFTCGLVLHPEVYRMADTLMHGRQRMIEAAMLLIGAGRGCDALLEDEPPDEEFRRRMRAERPSERVVMRALALWDAERVVNMVS